MQERRRQRDAAIEELHEIQRHLTQRDLRLETLHQIIEKGEGLDYGTQNVLSGLDEPERIKEKLNGIVASAIEVEPQFISAIEAALHDHLQAVLLTDSSLAGEIIGKLNDGKLGRAAIALQDFLHAEEGTDRQFMPNGAIAWALDRVKARPEVQPLMNRLLRDVVIVEDLATALRLKTEHPALCFVTLNGEMLSAHGVIHGGAGKEEAASTLRREAESRKLREEAGPAARPPPPSRRSRSRNCASSSRSRRATKPTRAMRRRRTATASASFTEKSASCSVPCSRPRPSSTASSGSRTRSANAWLPPKPRSRGTARPPRACGRQLEENHQREQELEREIENIIRREAESTERLNELKTAFAVEQSALQGVERQKAPLASRLEELQNSITPLRKRNLHLGAAHRVRAEREPPARGGSRGRAPPARRGRGGEREARRGAQRRLRESHGAGERAQRLRQRHAELNEHRSRAEVQQTRVDLRLENLTTQVHDRYQISLDAFEPDPHTLLLALNEQKEAARPQPQTQGHDGLAHRRAAGSSVLTDARTTRILTRIRPKPQPALAETKPRRSSRDSKTSPTGISCRRSSPNCASASKAWAR